MRLDLFGAFCVYAVVTSLTPGPANLLVLASGARHGALRTLPVILGIAAGLGAMVLVSGLGLWELLGHHPGLLSALKAAGIAYIACLAWQLMRARGGAAPAQVGPAQPALSWLNGLALPLFNPKAWIMALGAVTSYTPPGAGLQGLALVAISFVLINAPCMLVWAGFGGFISRLLTHPGRELAFNGAMGGLLLLSILPAARELLDLFT